MDGYQEILFITGDTTAASYYIGAELVALKPINAYAFPGGPIVKTFTKGQIVGVIASYIVSNGVVFWQLEKKTGDPTLWVQHETGVFDKDILLKTAQGTKDAATKKAIQDSIDASLAGTIEKAGTSIVKGAGDLVAGAGSALSGLGKNFTVIIVIVVVMVALYAFKTLKTA